MKKLAAVAVVALVAVAWCHDGGNDSSTQLRVATFNIENFPKSDHQVRGAFELLAQLDVAAVGVQEITDPAAFQRGAHQYLGKAWTSVFCTDCGTHRVGVVFDTERLRLVSTRSYDTTVVYPGAKPAFEARLERRDGAGIVRMIVVHLKAGGEHAATRARQLRALRPVLADAAATDDYTLLLGDFNATSPEDREAIAAVAGVTGTTWASRSLECTSYWNRNDGCRGTPLDHVITSTEPRSIAARGPCETVGCNPGDRCPVFHTDVSDHCPVTVELPAR